MSEIVVIPVKELQEMIHLAVKAEVDPLMRALCDKKITAKEAANILGIATRTLYTWRKDYPQLKYYVVGKSIRYSLHEVMEFKRTINK